LNDTVFYVRLVTGHAKPKSRLMKVWCTFLSFCLLLTCSSDAFAQSEVKFERVSDWYSGYGLITGVAQDPRGFIWFTSSAGLNQYAGMTVRSYRHHPTDTGSLSTNSLNCLYIDSSNIIWVGTSGGAVSQTVMKTAPDQPKRGPEKEGSVKCAEVGSLCAENPICQKNKIYQSLHSHHPDVLWASSAVMIKKNMAGIAASQLFSLFFNGAD
jgi:ligand-binding sensor domain-containing protein